MTTPVNETVDSLKVRAAGVASEQWPQLSASPANALWLTDSADPLNTSTNAALQISVMPNSVFLESLATDGVTNKQLQVGNAGGVALVPNGGNVGIRTTTPSEALEVNGAVKATAFLVNNAPLVSSQWTSTAGGITFAGGNVGIDTGANPIARTLHVEGSEIHSGGPGAGFSFANRGTTAFVDLPANGERWVWYALDGTARLWSSGDKLSVTPSGDVAIAGSLEVGGRTIQPVTIQSGEIGAGNLVGVVDRAFPVTFNGPFPVPPTLVVALKALDVDHGANLRINTYASNVSTTGFNLHFGVWADTHVYWAVASWIAYG